MILHIQMIIWVVMGIHKVVNVLPVTAMCRRCCAEVRENNTKGECLPTKEVVKAGRTCHIGTCSDVSVDMCGFVCLCMCVCGEVT